MATTWNPSDKAATISLSSGNLKATKIAPESAAGVRCVFSASTGKAYVEITIDSENGYVQCGLGTSATSLAQKLGDTSGYAYESGFGYKGHSFSWSAFGADFATGDIISIAFDLDANKLWWAKNGVWQDSGDPANGTNPAYTIDSDTYFVMISLLRVGEAATINAGSSAFSYSIPSGFETEFGDPITFVDGAVTCPMMTAEGFTGVHGEVSIPIMTVEGFTGATVAVTSPMMISDGELLIEPPHTAVGNVTNPMMTIEGFTSARSEVTVPMMTVEMEGVTGKVVKSNITNPMMTVTGTCKVEALINASITIPMQRVHATLTTGMVIVGAALIPMMAAEGTAYRAVIGDATALIPMMIADMRGFSERFEDCQILRYDDKPDILGSIIASIPMAEVSITEV